MLYLTATSFLDSKCGRVLSLPLLLSYSVVSGECFSHVGDSERLMKVKNVLQGCRDTRNFIKNTDAPRNELKREREKNKYSSYVLAWDIKKIIKSNLSKLGFDVSVEIREYGALVFCVKEKWAKHTNERMKFKFSTDNKNEVYINIHRMKKTTENRARRCNYRAN